MFDRSIDPVQACCQAGRQAVQRARKASSARDTVGVFSFLWVVKKYVAIIVVS